MDKVKAVENSYRDRMDALMTENTMLRRRWLNKTDEFCRYQSDIEKTQAQKIRRFKDTVSEGRGRAILKRIDSQTICRCLKDGASISISGKMKVKHSNNLSDDFIGGILPMSATCTI